MSANPSCRLAVLKLSVVFPKEYFCLRPESIYGIIVVFITSVFVSKNWLIKQETEISLPGRPPSKRTVLHCRHIDPDSVVMP